MALFTYNNGSDILYCFFPPLIAMALGYVFLKESLSILAILGSGLIMLGAVLINRNE